MKKTSCILALTLFFFSAYAQKSEISEAEKALNSKDYLLAKQHIELACMHPETENDAYTWYIASYTYSALVNSSPKTDENWMQKLIRSMHRWEELKRTDDKYADAIRKDVKRIYGQMAYYYWNKILAFVGSHSKEKGYYKEGEYVELFNLYENAIQYSLKADDFSSAGLWYLTLSSSYFEIGTAAYSGDDDFEKHKNTWFSSFEKCLTYSEKYNKNCWTEWEKCSNRKEYYIKTAEKTYNDSCSTLYDKGDYNRCFGIAKAAERLFLAADYKDGLAKTSEMIEKCRKQNVDEYIPESNKKNPNTYAFIIANEDYPGRHVPFAINDGRIFKQYCNKVLGIPEKHINIYENATGNNIVDCIESIKEAAIANSGDINVIFYYAGHAFPDEATKDAYLMPVDGNSARARTCYSLKELYKELGGINTKSVICFLDACFSGATREDQMLIAGRGVAIKPKEEIPQGNIVVFTSASGTETAHQYEAKHHGLFTYFLLKKLQESHGTTTLGDLYDYLSKQVKSTSYDVNQKIQTPSVIPSAKMQSTWREIKL